MSLKLVKLSYEYKYQLEEMMEEWIKYNNENKDANHSPWAIFKNDYHDFDNYLNNLEIKNDPERVPDSVLYLLDTERNIFLGAVNIRHYLNDYLFREGGHIGDGIRPSERRKGYATKMIALALIECKKLGIDKVLFTVNTDNIGSQKSIINNGGVFEKEFLDSDGIMEMRFWIDLENK